MKLSETEKRVASFLLEREISFVENFEKVFALLAESRVEPRVKTRPV
jgi:hypothetical protein